MIQNPSNLPTSFQGVELSDVGSNNLRSIYIASGDESNGKSNKLYRYNTAGEYKNAKVIDDTGVWTYYGSSSLNLSCEMESVRLNGNYLMFVLADTAGNKYRQVIAKVAKSNLSYEVIYYDQKIIFFSTYMYNNMYINSDSDRLLSCFRIGKEH